MWIYSYVKSRTMSAFPLKWIAHNATWLEPCCGIVARYACIFIWKIDIYAQSNWLASHVILHDTLLSHGYPVQ